MVCGIASVLHEAVRAPGIPVHVQRYDTDVLCADVLPVCFRADVAGDLPGHHFPLLFKKFPPPHPPDLAGKMPDAGMGNEIPANWIMALRGG